MAAGPKFELLPSPSVPGELLAFGPTDGEGVFVGVFRDAGIQYLDLSAKSGDGHWAAAAAFDGRALAEFGVHFRPASGGEGDKGVGTHISFLEAPRSWVCLRIPAPGKQEGKSKAAELVARAKLPAEAAAACGRPGGDFVTVVSKNGVLTFFATDTAKALANFRRLESAIFADGAVAVAQLGQRRVAMVHQAGSSIQFFVLELNEQNLCDMQSQGSIELPESIAGSRLHSMESPSSSSGDSLLMCWDRPSGKKGGSTSQSFTSVGIDAENQSAKVAPFSVQGGETQLVWWAPIGGYLLECRRTSGGAAALLTLREAKFGVCVAEAELPLSKAKAATKVLGAAAGGVTALVAGADVSAVRWSLQPFALQMLVGRAPQPLAPGAEGEALASLRRAIGSGKRPLSADPALEDLFGAKRRKATDGLLASELLSRRLAPSPPLVEVVLAKRCLRSAQALLQLEELDDDSAVQLLAAWPGLLPRVVRRKHTAQLLNAALGKHLPAAELTEVVQALLTWIEAFREYPEEDVRRAAPELPTVWESVRFLSALADGCLPLLVRLDRSLVERAVETLNLAKRDAKNGDTLHAVVHAAARVKEPIRGPATSAGIEVALLPL